MARFRKKPVEVEAVRYTGRNATEIAAWMHPTELRQKFQGGLLIPTLEGDMLADVGDWIIRGVQGEFYPCKPDMFEAVYEEVTE